MTADEKRIVAAMIERDKAEAAARHAEWSFNQYATWVATAPNEASLKEGVARLRDAHKLREHTKDEWLRTDNNYKVLIKMAAGVAGDYDVLRPKPINTKGAK